MKHLLVGLLSVTLLFSVAPWPKRFDSTTAAKARSVVEGRRTRYGNPPDRRW